MKSAQKGDPIIIHYKGMLKDGTLLDSSFGKTPLKFVLGEGEVKKTFDNKIMGMVEGETRIIMLPPEEAYGEYDNELVTTLDKNELPAHIDPHPDMQFKAPLKKDKIIKFTVKDVSENKVTLDGNHPLAGKELVYEIKLLKIG